MHSVIIPASGSATRMRGIPKFLLPSGSGDLSLLEIHIRNVKNFASEILIGINPVFFEIVVEAKLELNGAQIFPMRTSTMTETVIRLIDKSNAERFTVLMPDTAFESPESYKFDTYSHQLDLSLWRIRDEQKGKLGQVLLDSSNKVIDCVDKDPECKYALAWGALTFDKEWLKFLNESFPHIGYGIAPAVGADFEVYGDILEGSYWDCGTPSEYISYLRSVVT